MKRSKVLQALALLAALLVCISCFPVEETTTFFEVEDTTTISASDWETTIATSSEDSNLPLSSQNVEVRLEPQFLERQHSEDLERRTRGHEVNASSESQRTSNKDEEEEDVSKLDPFQEDWPKVATRTSEKIDTNRSASVNLTQSSVPAASAVNRATPRKIMGFVNLPVLPSNTRTKDSSYGHYKIGSVQHKDIVTTGPQWVYGPVKDVRKTLESFGVPSTDSWLDLAKLSGTRYASFLPTNHVPPAPDVPSTQAPSKPEIVETSSETVPHRTSEVPLISSTEVPETAVRETQNEVSRPSGDINEDTALPKTNELPPKKLEKLPVDDDSDAMDFSEMDGHKYQVEEETADGYIVGEFGIVNKISGNLRGVRYTAHSSINPQLIQAALRTFLSPVAFTDAFPLSAKFRKCIVYFFVC